MLPSLLLGASAFAQQGARLPLPSFAELEAAGATIGEIRVVARNVFDTADPQEDNWLFRLANTLHVSTRPGVIEKALLFRSGEPLRVRLIEETERLLRASRYLYDVQFRPLAVRDGVVDIEVATRDTWSIDASVGIGRSGGENSSALRITEQNLLGTGTSIGFVRSKDVDRSSNEFQIAHDRVFGSRTAVAFSHASSSDGRRDAASIVRPFHALDSRWTAGATAVKDDRIESVYQAGEILSRYRHRSDQAELFAGASRGLVDGWVQRYTLGASYTKAGYSAEPGQVAPARLPRDETLIGPFVRYAVVEDRFDRELNRNLIGRPEFFALGLAGTLRLGWAPRGLGSSDDVLQYAGSIARGFEPRRNHLLITAASFTGELAEGRARRQRVGAQAQYYLPQSSRWLFYAAAAGDMQTRPDPAEALQLGGDNGLRGYPLRYQSGTRRALVTLEERFYTDLYLWRLFRIGGAAFVDAGRAWGGDTTNRTNPGWLGDAGLGLRIVSVRSASSNVLHVDLAFPIGGATSISKVQLLVKSKTSF